MQDGPPQNINEIDNGMPTFSTPSTHKKNSCRMLEEEKITCKHILQEKKKFIVN